MITEPIAISISESVAKNPWLRLPTTMKVVLTMRQSRVNSMAGPMTMSMS